MLTPSLPLTPDTARHLSLLRTLGEAELSPLSRWQWLGWDASSRYLLSVQKQGGVSLRWWDLHAETPQPYLAKSIPGCIAAWFLPGSQRLLTVTVRGTLQTWSVSDGQLLSSVETGGSVSHAYLSPDGTRLLLVASVGRVMLWDLERRWLVWRKEDPGQLHGCALSPDGAYAAVGAAEEQQDSNTRATLLLWDARTGRRVTTQAFGARRIWAVAFTPSGEHLVAANSSGGLLFLALPALETVRSLRAPASHAIHLEFNPEGSLLAASPDTSAFVVIDLRDGQHVFAYSDLDDQQGSTANFSPDGRFVAWGMDDGKVGIWGVKPRP
ncbi:WD40 repeat domain-containing protein [Corallococcus aberystwythensis]|uniref:WD40 repeat domain-containing protein n=1 Tax=Corallococcus aberystwythensis TaxID=2316722 RepID=A0A3A8PG81_9BACT|nr:WD40 repeat domain-containing protein [Corallococcus aberystwythensis]RKH55357.1 WD40 repeat domain-containing protein [Corallococcus aberystwythensis]